MRVRPDRRRIPQWAALPTLLFLGLKLTSLLTNLRLFPTLRVPAQGHQPAPPGNVALLIPMRDEASRLPDTLPALLRSGAQHVVFLDDESKDDSAVVVRSSATAPGVTARVEVIAGSPRPAGWVGKTWACRQLADATDAEVLIFCDADVHLSTDAVAVILAEMRRQGADVFSVFCRQLVGTWTERLLLPLITDVVLCFLPFPLLRAPVPAAATASGALLAIRRSAYDKLGGFAAVRSEIVEDVALARLTRSLGLQLGLALGGDVAQVRMYRNRGEVIAGLGRGLVPVTGGRRWLVATGLGWHLMAYTVPTLLAPRSRSWAAAAAFGILERVLVEAKTGGNDWPAALLVAASPIAAIPVVRQAIRGTQTWKGRTYGVGVTPEPDPTTRSTTSAAVSG